MQLVEVLGALCLAAAFGLLIWAAASRASKHREHDEGDKGCWCGPELWQICPEWGGEIDACAETCWRCHGEGWVEPYDPERRTLVIHRKDGT